MTAERTRAQDRRSLAVLLRTAGWSVRRIAEEVGAGVMTCWRDTQHVETPDRVIGRDGCSYPARRS